MRAEEPFLVRHADLIFALKTFAASMLALVIALAIDLPRPYWAMATVYITSQPLAGATSSKAFFRVMGTWVGAIMTVAMVPNLVNAPELLRAKLSSRNDTSCLRSRSRRPAWSGASAARKRKLDQA